jgi:hypothetical protein
MVTDIDLAKLGEYPIKNAILEVEIKRKAWPSGRAFFIWRDAF